MTTTKPTEEMRQRRCREARPPNTCGDDPKVLAQQAQDALFEASNMLTTLQGYYGLMNYPELHAQAQAAVVMLDGVEVRVANLIEDAKR